jgi:tRNA(His) 5'-end guanylyltransferase
MSEAKNALAARMKGYYEDRYRIYLPRSTYTIIRVDGKAFHLYTRKASRPFDEDLESAFAYATCCLCKEIQGCKFAYLQSDEVSVLLTDFEQPGTQAWFDGNLQKIVSVAASHFTSAFNNHINYLADENPAPGLESYKFQPRATFDARAFVIPHRIEVENYFIWRQRDWVRNAINMMAEVHFSPRQLDKRNNKQRLEDLATVGVQWENIPVKHRFGRLCTYKGEWLVRPAFPFVEERSNLTEMIPAQLPWPRGPWSNAEEEQ